MKKENFLYNLSVMFLLLSLLIISGSSYMLFFYEKTSPETEEESNKGEDLDITETDNEVSKTVQITNLTDTGFSVVWVSEDKEVGYIEYGSSIDNLTELKWDERDNLTTRGTYYVHSVSVNKLQSETTYYVIVYSGESIYDNNGKGYVVATYATLNSPAPVDFISGEIENLPSSNEAIVVAYIEDTENNSSNKISTLTDDGNWVLSLGNCRTNDGTSYISSTNGSTLFLDPLTTIDTNTYTKEISNLGGNEFNISL